MLLALILSVPAAAGGPRVARIEGDPIDGEPVSIEDRKLVAADGSVHDLVQIRRIEYDRPVREPARDAAPVRLEMASGDVVYGKIAGSEDMVQHLLLLGAAAGKVGVPYDRTLVLLMRTHPSVDPLPVREEKQIGDLAYVADGEKSATLEGSIEEFTTDKVRWTWEVGEEKKKISIPLARLRGIRFRIVPAPEEPSGVLARFYLVDGSRLSGVDPTLSDGVYRFRLLEGKGDVSISAANVSHVDLSSDLLLFLSDEEPVEVAERNFIGLPHGYSFQRDRTFSGGPIRLGANPGVLYEKGLGVHAYSSLAFDLHRRYRKFRAIAGSDPNRPADDPRALEERKVLFRVWGDGKLLFQSDPVDIRSAPLPIEVGIEGVRILVLEVDEGDDLDLGDHAVWASAMVVK